MDTATTAHQVRDPVISLANWRATHRRAAAPPAGGRVHTLHTAVPGRARFRVAELYRAEALAARVGVELGARDGVQSVTVNPLTGSVLVLFVSGRTVAELAAELERLLAELRLAPAPHVDTGAAPRRARRRAPASPATQPAARAWYRVAVEDALVELGCAREHGLAAATVAERRRRYGANLLPATEPRSALAIFLGQFRSLPVALLGVSALVSAATGGLADAAVIVGVVLVNAAIGFATESQAERTISALTRAVHPSVHVWREAAVQLVDVADVVVGDLLVLAPGSFVAADARLVETRELSVDESSLTGESLPVAKHAEVLPAADAPLADRVNMVYRGTRVTGGQGFALVVATGAATEIGHIQRLLGEAESPQTPMERQLGTLGNQLVLIAVAVCGGMFVVGLVRGYGGLPMLKGAISLAVAAVPEGLPTVATTTLALGLARMRREKVLMRSLDAVETLGSVQVLCLDKTGTLTRNRMEVVAAHAGFTPLTVADGRFRDGARTLDPYALDELLRLIHVAVLCNETEVNGGTHGYVLTGTPTESALMRMAIAAGVDVVELLRRYPRVRIDHRSERRPYMLSLHRAGDGALVAVKGSPPEVLALARWCVRDGVRLPLGETERAAILEANEHMAGEALRVLGVAYAEVGPGAEPGDDGLTWLGLLGMADPLRDGVRELIPQFHAAGIDTIMITGDQSPTAHAIGRALQLSGSEQIDILDSTHLESLDPEVLKGLAARVDVFARVSPSHKLAIVQALQRAGKVVAMTGDGINDGPALKAADIGIAMGTAGTDVARAVADVVLEDDELQTLIVAIGQGRTIYSNIRKSVHFLLSTNLSEIIVMFGAVAAGLGQPLNPMQLLWINLVTDIFPALGLALEAPEPDVLRQPPRDPSEPIVRRSDFRRIGIEGALLSAGTLAAYGYGVARYGAGPRSGTLAFLTLTAAQLLHAVSCRSERHRVFGAEPLAPNRTLRLALAGSFGLQAAAALVPGLRGLLGLAPVGALDLAVAGAGALLPFAVNEATKGAARPGAA